LFVFIERPGLLSVESAMNTTAYRSRLRRCWRQEIRPLLVLALVIFAVRSSLADWNDVPTGSMKPTILEGDRVFINKLAYDLKVPFTTWHLAEWSHPQRGDIVVCYSPHDGTRLVKRVVGLPGDLIELQDERLVINGKPVDYVPLSPEISGQLTEAERQGSLFAAEQLPAHPHAVMATPAFPAKRTFDPVPVPEGHYFMMGDNRDNSFDSRYFGVVGRKQILGKATAVAFSLDRNRYWLPRAQRFFQPLDAAGSP
jgi:signal peptidase I